MKRYVAGFMFSDSLNRVALIWKNRPTWQAGKLNGIGGHIEEGETPRRAMVREFQEETSVSTTPSMWSRFLVMRGAQTSPEQEAFEVHFFAARGPIDFCRTMTDENIGIVCMDRVYPGRESMIENLPWLIGMAVDHLTDGRPSFAVVKY